MSFVISAMVAPSVWLVLASMFGVIIGSFLNVVIYRFHTGKSLSGHSHCLSCGTALRWYELFPLFSYLALRGRCRSCHSHIPVRYFLVELLTGGLFMLGAWSVATRGQMGFVQFDIVALLLVWFMLAVAVVIVVYDLYHFIIPDSLTLALTVTSIAWVVLDMWPLLDLNALLLPIGSALLGSAFFLVLWLVSKGTWLGFGDVKLAFPLGLLAGPNLVFSFVVLSFWLGAAISLLLLGYGYLRRGKQALPNTSRGLTMKSAVPFAPFLVAGGLLVFFTNFDVLALFA